MKALRIVLMSLAVVIAVGAAVASSTSKPRTEFYGLNASSVCVEGTSLSSCNLIGNTNHCKVTVGGNRVDAYEGINTTPDPDECIVPLYNSTPVE